LIARSLLFCGICDTSDSEGGRRALHADGATKVALVIELAAKIVG